MKRLERKVLFWWVVMLILMLFNITSVCGCSQGLSVANLDITPSESMAIAYIVIYDQDSTQHWYESLMHNVEHYCYKHHIWEDVRKKNSE